MFVLLHVLLCVLLHFKLYVILLFYSTTGFIAKLYILFSLLCVLLSALLDKCV